MSQNQESVFQKLRSLGKKLDTLNLVVENVFSCNSELQNINGKSTCINPLDRLIVLSDEVKEKQMEVRDVLDHILEDHQTVHNVVSACEDYMNEQKSTLASIEDYLSQYGYKTWEIHNEEVREKEKHKCKKADKVQCPETNQSDREETVVSEETTKCEPTEELVSDSCHPSLPRIDDFGLSRYFMEKYLTNSVSKGNKLARGLRLGLSVQKSCSVMSAKKPAQDKTNKTSHTSKQLAYNTPSHPQLVRHVPVTPEQNDSDGVSPIAIPVPPVFTTPGVKQLRPLGLDHAIADDITTMINQPTADISGIFSMDTDLNNESDLDPPCPPCLNINLDELDDLTRHYNVLNLQRP